MDSIVLSESTNHVRADNWVEPSVADLYGGPLPPGFIAAVVIAFVLLAGIIFIYVRQLQFILHYTPGHLLGRTVLLNSAYLIVGVLSFTSLMLPGTDVFCETLCHMTYTILVYQYFCYVVDYAGGENEMINATDEKEVHSMRTLPCCCCCMFIKPTKLTMQLIQRMRFMVLQVPIIQPVVLFALNIVNITNPHLYYNAEFATLPIIIISMILGEWSLNMLVHMLQPFYADFNPKPKYISILMILFFIKFQTVVSTQIVNSIEYEEPVLPRIMRNVIVQVLVLAEMLLLACWTSRLYKFPKKSDFKDDSLEI